MSARVPTPRDWPARPTRRRRHSASSNSSWSRASGTARSARSYTRFQPRRSVHTTSPYMSARSTATFVPDQSHHSLVFFAPPNSVAVRAFGAELFDDLVVGAVRQGVVPVRAGSVGAAAEGEVGPFLHGEDAGGVGPVLEGVCVLPVGGVYCLAAYGAGRAYGMSSWERARTEIVSSWTAEVSQDSADTRPCGPGCPGGPGPAGRCGGLRRRRVRWWDAGGCSSCPHGRRCH